MTVPVPPNGRFLIGFGANVFDWTPTWTRIDSHPNLVTSFQIDRGRQYELDRTDVGRATVQIADPDGILDPTNSHGPYYGQIEPLLPAMLNRYNPTTGTWHTRYRGYIDEMDYVFDPSQRVNRLTFTLVDVFEVLAAIQMFPDSFGDDPSVDNPDAADQVWFAVATMGAPSTDPIPGRIPHVLAQAGIPANYYVIFTGNVLLHAQTYTPGESVMSVIQEAADAEFPGVSNVFTDSRGRLCAHGRLAKFDPATIAAGAGDDAWDWHHYKAGDHAAVAAGAGTVAQLRRFSFNRGLSKIINYAYATPKRDGVPLTATQVAAQIVRDNVSIGIRGYRSWEAQDLLTKEGLLDSSSDLVETRRFSDYYVTNYAQARNRVTDCAVRTVRPGTVGAGITWELLSKIDIGDRLDVTVASPGGGGFNLEPYFVEGIHEENEPLNPTYDLVTVSLDLSPAGYFTDTTMFPRP